MAAHMHSLVVVLLLTFASCYRRHSGMGSYIFMDTMDLLLYPRTTYYKVQRGRADENRMGFLEAVFSFVLGDGNPNSAFEEQRWQMVPSPCCLLAIRQACRCAFLQDHSDA